MPIPRDELMTIAASLAGLAASVELHGTTPVFFLGGIHGAVSATCLAGQHAMMDGTGS